MRYLISLVASMLAIVACDSLIAQERTSLPAEVREGANYLVGQWSGKGTMNGQLATMQMTVRWARGQQHQVYQWTISSSGKKIFGNAIGGWDRAANQWIEYMMESDGTRYMNRWPQSAVVDEGTFQGEHVVYRDGKERKATAAVQRMGLDRWTYEIKTSDGASETLLSMIFNRVQAASSATGDEFLAFWKNYLQGTWTTEVVAGEAEGMNATGAVGTWTCEPSATNLSMVFSATMDGDAAYSAVAGYDPKSKAWKEVFFMADGSHLTQLYRARAGELSGSPVGKVIKGTAEYIYPDGSIEKAQIKVAAINEDKCEYSVTNRRVGEKKLANLKIVFERKKE